MATQSQWRSTADRSFLTDQVKDGDLVNFGSGLQVQHGSSLMTRHGTPAASAKGGGAGYGFRVPRFAQGAGAKLRGALNPKAIASAGFSGMVTAGGAIKSATGQVATAGAFGGEMLDAGQHLTGNGALTDDIGHITNTVLGKAEAKAGSVTGKVVVNGAKGGMKLGYKATQGAATKSASFSAQLAAKASMQGAGISIKSAAAAAKAAQVVLHTVVSAMAGIAGIVSALPVVIVGVIVVVIITAILSFFLPTASVSAAVQMCSASGGAMTAVPVGGGDGGGAADPAVSDAPAFDGQFNPPLPGAMYVTSAFGMRFHPVDKVYKMHYGVDLGAPNGTPILAAAPGVVTKAFYESSCGNRVEVTHLASDGTQYMTRYCHMSQIESSIGQQVQAGQEIGKVGNTGKSTGNHLHFEIHKGGVAQDPWPYVAGGTVGQIIPAGVDPELCAKLGVNVVPADTLPVSATYPAQAATVDDPTTSGKITPRMHAVYQAVTGLPGQGGVKSIGCYRPSDPYPWHPSGRACDLMYANGTFPTGKTLADGNATATWLTQHAEEYGIHHLIWQGRIWAASTGKWKTYTSSVYSDEQTNPTTGHYDHIHVSVW